MPKREGRRVISRKNARIIAISLLTVSLAVAFLCVEGVLAPVRYEIKIGEPSPATILAPSEAVDEVNTEALREQARNQAGSTFVIDQNQVATLTAGAKEFFTQLARVRTEAGEYASTNDPDGTGGLSALTQEQIAALCAITAPELDEASLQAVIAASSVELQTLRDVVLSKLDTALTAGLSEGGMEGVKSSCKREINAMTGLSAGLKKAASLVFDQFMQPTLIVDEEASALAQSAAAAAVEPITVKRGQVIVEKGGAISASQYALLNGLNLIKTEKNDPRTGIGLALVLLAAFALFSGYLRLFQKNIFYDVKRMAILAVLIVLTMGLAYLCNKADARLSPALIAIMLCAILVEEKTAMALTALLSIPLGVMAGGSGSGLLGADTFGIILSTLAAGIIVVFALRRTQSRSALIAAGAAGGVAASLMVIATELMKKSAFLAMLEGIGWTMGSAMLSTLLVVGSLSIWENLFDVATAARLNELSNTNHPLLKQLMTEAPGTYQHSMMTAGLAEGAAERIGADPLLARVGAYYHDVGKLRRPLYFKENQKNGENIHDTLPPLESAQAIIAHQKDGVTLLTRYKLPTAVIRVCAEHHGNALMTYFYYKAKQADENVSQKGFRYSGNRPSTKESAIVMMADSCEAAVRSLGETNSEAVEQMVHKIIWSKLNDSDNMMTNAPLTIAEFSEIEKSFLKTFAGLMHDRIEYPDLEGDKL